MDTLNMNVPFPSASVSLLFPIVDPTGNTLITPPCTLVYDSGYEQDAQGKIWGSHNSGNEAWSLLGCDIGGFHHFEGSQCIHLLGQAGILLGLSVPCDTAPQPRIHLLHAIFLIIIPILFLKLCTYMSLSKSEFYFFFKN